MNHKFYNEIISELNENGEMRRRYDAEEGRTTNRIAAVAGPSSFECNVKRARFIRNCLLNCCVLFRVGKEAEYGRRRSTEKIELPAGEDRRPKPEPQRARVDFFTRNGTYVTT